MKAGEQQQTAHIFPECDGAAMVVEPSVDGSTEAERDPLEGFDYRQFFEAGEDAVEAKISGELMVVMSLLLLWGVVDRLGFPLKSS